MSDAATSSRNALAGPPKPRRVLSLFDSVCIIVGIVIGSGIFSTPWLVAGQVGGSEMMLFCWVLGGAVSLLGALCYAELISTYPHAGGDYQYLTHSYGRRVGFVFAWTQFWVVRPGSICAMAYIFADYAHQLFTPQANPDSMMLWALGLIGVITAINAFGLRVGKTTQNLLTVLKIAGLLTVFVLAFFAPGAESVARERTPMLGVGQALIFVMFAFGGWTDIAFVAAEVKSPERNAFRAMLLGVGTVTATYLLLNVAYLWALGFDGVQQTRTVAAATAEAGVGAWGARFVSALILVAAAGALNGIVLTGARLYYAFGRDHAAFTWLGKWNARINAPVNSLVVQGILTCAITALFGSRWWFDLFPTASEVSFQPNSGFERTIYYTTPAYWFFVILAVMSLFLSRYRQPGVSRPFRVPGFPVTPIVFCGVCGFVIYSSLDFAIANGKYEAIWSAGFVGLGLLLSFFSRPPRRQSDAPLDNKVD